jgi:O-antigen/teichoic acid export membrane protein
VSKRTDSPGLGSLASGALTGLALAIQTGFAAVVGLVVAREFGRGEETDGLFAAYSVYVVVILSANAIRVVVMPPLARARAERRLGAEVVAYAVTVAVVGLPLLLAGVVAADPISWLLTGNGPELARAAATDALPWMLLGGVFHLYAGLAASALAALDDYVVSAAGYMLGGGVGLAFILLRADTDGIEAVAWGLALNGVVTLLVPAVALGLRARSRGVTASAVRPSELDFRSRLGELGTGIAIALAIQAIYLVCVPLAGREGVGALTSFTYAYLLMAAVVAISASSLGLVTSVPLTRAGLDPERTERHVVASFWLAVVAVGAAAGVFGLAGAEIVEAFLGAAYGDDVGSELGRLIVLFAPWAVVTVGISVTFPLVFVAGRTRLLPALALGAFVIHIPLAVAGQAALGLDGLALALAATTAVMLGCTLAILEALERTARGLAVAALVVAVIAVGAFVPPGLLIGTTVIAAVVGAFLYCLLLVAVRPQPLLAAWKYLRTLA